MAKSIPIEFSGFHAARLNAVYSMQRVKMHTYWMQRSPWIVVEFSWFHAAWRNGTLLNAVDLCSKMECSGCYAAWPKASRLNAVDSMQRHLMQRIPCIVAQWIPIVCSGVHAARPNASRLNAMDFMQHHPKHPDWMQWIPCIVIEFSLLHAAW